MIQDDGKTVRGNVAGDGMRTISLHQQRTRRDTMFKWIAATAAMAALIGGCTDPAADTDTVGNGEHVTGDDVQREISEAADATADFTDKKKDEYVREMKQELEEMDDEIARLEAKSKDLSEDARAEWDQQSEALKEKRKAAGEKLDEVQESSAESWEEFREDADNAWSELSRAFDHAAAQFESP